LVVLSDVCSIQPRPPIQNLELAQDKGKRGKTWRGQSDQGKNTGVVACVRESREIMSKAHCLRIFSKASKGLRERRDVDLITTATEADERG
jgi:hypothetical protein